MSVLLQAMSVQLQALPMQPQAVPTRPHTLPTTCEAQKSKRRMPHSRATCATSKPETVTLLRREAATTIRGEQARSDEEHRCRLRNRRLLLNVRRAPDLERDVRVAEMAVGVETEGDVFAVRDVLRERVQDRRVGRRDTPRDVGLAKR